MSDVLLGASGPIMEGIFQRTPDKTSGGRLYPREAMDKLIMTERHKLQDRKRAEILDRFLSDGPNPFLIDNMERLRDELVDSIVEKRTKHGKDGRDV